MFIWFEIIKASFPVVWLFTFALQLAFAASVVLGVKNLFCRYYYITSMDVLQHALPWEIESLRKSITNMNALIQTQARRICALEAENRDLQTRLTNRRRHRHTATQTNRSTQTRDNTESDTRSAVVFVSRKRKSRSELCSMGLKRRKEEEETAFKNVATLFGEQVENEIKRVGVTVEYGDGVEHEFLAWRKNRPEGDTFDDSKEDGPETDDIQRTEQEEDEAMARTLSVLKLKIRHSISYSLLHELRMEGFPVPPQAKIREQSERLGRCIEILQVSTVHALLCVRVECVCVMLMN